ncbi:uncharacterized protein LOC107625372 [Arachis ipaensis]|uniref:uncharacterized protein LOC107613138 n=1 Tax=Arachis ipaensis TaxID=130454 RepID=UPI0007AF6295|nr:uncharacterized protein LOC107613138 [Arachis ipaensis]XP_016183483.1 uncharacterized protein LOC107625372 [Arachis ipaensis]
MCILSLIGVEWQYLLIRLKCLIQVTHRHVYPLKCQIFDGRILVSKGIGNSIATWQTCFLVLSGSYLYVFETAESQSYQRYLRAWIIGSGNGEDRIAPLLVLSSSFKK